VERTRTYAGEGVVIHFEPRRCIHAGECVGGLPGVFDSGKKPWIDATGASADAIADAVRRCPSGALTFERSDGGPAEEVQKAPSMTVVKGGPLHVRGAIEIRGPDGAPLEVPPRFALCRCGASGNKPFCDNSHLTIGFDSDA
jgi:uncharacterized Fe-S cluster protein YjdI